MRLNADDWDRLIAWVCVAFIVLYFMWAVFDPVGFVNYGL